MSTPAVESVDSGIRQFHRTLKRHPLGHNQAVTITIEIKDCLFREEQAELREKTMIGRGKASAIVGAALLLAVSGAEAASHGSSGGGGTHSNGTTTPFHPALQQCTGP